MASASRAHAEPPGADPELPYGPRLDELLAYEGPDTVTVVEAAIAELATFWSPLGLADAAATLSCLGFLAHEAERRLWGAVADARGQGHSWDEVASRLGRDAPGVEQCYGTYADWRQAQGSKGGPIARSVIVLPR